MPNPAETITLKGYFTTQYFRELKKHLKKEELEKIQARMPVTKIQSIHDYPVTLQTTVEKLAGEIAYPDKSEAERDFILGKISFDSFAESLIGKTLMLLNKNNPLKLSLDVCRIFPIMANGIKTETKEIGPDKVLVKILNNPFAPHGLRGFFQRALERLDTLDVTCEFNHVKDYEYDYIVSWKLKE